MAGLPADSVLESETTLALWGLALLSAGNAGNAARQAWLTGCGSHSCSCVTDHQHDAVAHAGLDASAGSAEKRAQWVQRAGSQAGASKQLRRTVSLPSASEAARTQASRISRGLRSMIMVAGARLDCQGWRAL